MSPVSRSRKPKKSKKKNRSTKRQQLPPRRQTPPTWFRESCQVILDRDDLMLAAPGPRELEQVVCELIGEQLHAAMIEGRAGLWFDQWFEVLARTAAECAAEGAWEAPWRLLHALNSISAPSLASIASAELDRCRPHEDLLGDQPKWLANMSEVSATGAMWQLRDTYGTRRAIVAEFEYPQESAHPVFLFDHDVSGFVELVSPGLFDDLEHAVEHWREQVGDSAADAVPTPVSSSADLVALTHLVLDDHMLTGTEPREVMDNWFRATRRLSDLWDALERQGMTIPEAEYLYGPVDADSMIDEFGTWHEQTHGTLPDDEVVGAMTMEWMEGALPETWYLVSPRRVDFQLRLIGDWAPPGDPVTEGAIDLMPQWVRWLGERAGLSAPLIGSAMAVCDK